MSVSLLFTQTVAMATLFAPERRLRTRRPACFRDPGEKCGLNLFGTSLNVHGVTQRTKYMGVFRTTVAFFVFTNELLDTRFDALLPGIRIAKLTNTAIQCGFTHVSTAFGLQFIYSLKHRHSGKFLAGTQ